MCLMIFFFSKIFSVLFQTKNYFAQGKIVYLGWFVQSGGS